jgi:hypothetical protein
MKLKFYAWSITQLVGKVGLSKQILGYERREPQEPDQQAD